MAVWEQVPLHHVRSTRGQIWVISTLEEEDGRVGVSVLYGMRLSEGHVDRILHFTEGQQVRVRF